MRRSSRSTAVLLGVLLVLAPAVAMRGCRKPRLSRTDRPAAIARPADPDLSTPESAVRAYADWISYAYRTLESDAATPVMSAAEEVRIDSYVEYNRQAGRAIEQRLAGSAYRTVSASDSTATLAGSEDWTYRYVAPDGARYLSETKRASYEVTYTVVLERGAGWVIDRVQVESRSAR